MDGFSGMCFDFSPIYGEGSEDIIAYSIKARENVIFGESVRIPTYYRELPVAAIGASAFESHEEIVRVCIPRTVKKIGACAFCECVNLESVSVYGYGDITDIRGEVGDYAFYGCEKLREADIPNGVKSIGEYAFENCYLLESIRIPEGVAIIWGYAFARCHSLMSIELPKSLESIQSEAFIECTRLAEVINRSLIGIEAGSAGKGRVACYAAEVYSGDSKIRREGKYIFYDGADKKYLLRYTGEDKDIVLPEKYRGKPYDIYDSALSGSKAESVTVSPFTEKIYGRAFSGCASLRHAEIPDGVVSIGDAAFFSCTSLEEINIPESVKSIGENVFAYCKKLKTAVIPEGTKFLGGTFMFCNSLVSVSIPKSARGLGGKLFYKCAKLEKIIYRGSEAEWERIEKDEDWDFMAGDFRVISEAE